MTEPTPTPDALLPVLDEPAERWRAVPGYEGSYEISDRGRFRSLDRVIVDRNGVQYRLKGRHLVTSLNADGYPMAALGKSRREKVHRLVALVFIGEPPPEHEVCHKNGTRTDCRVENLYYGTRSENVLDMVRHGTHQAVRKVKCPQGHLLVSPNIRPIPNRRKCKSCDRGRATVKNARVRHGIELDFRTEADAHYVKLMMGSGRLVG